MALQSPWRAPGLLAVCIWLFRYKMNLIYGLKCWKDWRHSKIPFKIVSMALVIDCSADWDPAWAGRRGDLVFLQHLLDPGAELFQMFSTRSISWSEHWTVYERCTVIHSQHLTCVAGPRGRCDGSARRPCLRLEGRDRWRVSQLFFSCENLVFLLNSWSMIIHVISLCPGMSGALSRLLSFPTVSL